jgi:diguanylate cyclase (GGDEF)-like protein
MSQIEVDAPVIAIAIPTAKDPRLRVLLVGLICLLASADAFALDPRKAITQYRRDSWTLAHGLPHSSINRISQDSEGYLWMSTFGGAVRFDGVRFESLAPLVRPGEPFADAIADTLEDKNGVRWFATGRGLLRTDPVSTRIFRQEDGLPGNGVQALAWDPEGRLMVGTGRGLVLIDRDPPFQVTPVSALSGVDVTSFLHDRAGRLWVGTRHGLHVRSLEGEWQRIAASDLGTLHIWSVVEDKAGTIWIASRRGGLLSWTNGVVRRYGRKDGLNHDVIRALLVDRGGSLWIGTAGSGVSRLRDGRFERLTATRGDIPSDVIRALFEDREGNVWVGTAGGGLTRLSDAPFTRITTREGLPDDSVWTVTEDAEGGQWIGSNGGLVSLRNGVMERHHAVGDEQPIVLSLLATRDRRLLVGTYRGLFQLRASRLVRLDQPGDLPSAVVRSLVETSDGSVWIGTEHGAVRYSPGSRPAFETPRGDHPSDISVIRESRAGGLWLGLERGGIVKYEGARFVNQPWAKPLGTIRDVLEDERGVLWIAGTGLGRYENARLFRFGQAEGFEERRIHALQEDGLGSLWMSTNTGIYRVSIAELDAFATGGSTRPRFEPFRESEGVPAAEGNGGSQPASWRTRDGRLWFATIGGLAGIDPKAATRTDPPAIARIEHGLIDGGEVEPGSALPRGTRRIEFEYTALLLTSPQQVRFRYRLEPVDTEWSEAGARRSVAYARLNPGVYRFRVAAAGRDGVFAEDPTPFEFEVTPYIYERPLVRGGLVVLGLALLIGLGALRMRGLRRRGLELERIVAEKTRDLERLASEDPLTGLANRRQFDHELEKEIQRSHRTGQPIALIMADVDHFKDFNDAYGHPQGDVCLRTIAAVLRAHGRRAGDLVARLGGEEFAILLPDMMPAVSEELAGRLLEAMANERVPHAAASLGVVTLSLGVATVGGSALASTTPNGLVEQADAALYEAKAAGRNRMVARRIS